MSLIDGLIAALPSAAASAAVFGAPSLFHGKEEE